jgi:hypothetical protein
LPIFQLSFIIRVTFTNGDEFEGCYNNNNHLQGDVLYKFATGESLKGSFHNNVPVGSALFTSSQGETVSVTWVTSCNDIQLNANATKASAMDVLFESSAAKIQSAGIRKV